MKKTNLVDLMQRYITGQVTEQEKAKIEAWLDVKKTDDGADLVLSGEDEEKLFHKITSNLHNIDEIRTFRPAKGKLRSLYSARWFQVAATLLILISASYSLWFIAQKNGTYEVTAAMAPEKAILADGTIVWLQKASRLTYDNENKGIRQAALKGEALFEVAKDPSRPFIISCGDMKVRVIGTSFNLKDTENGIELKVLTGKVNISSPADKQGIDVIPDEVVLYSKDGEVKKTTMKPGDVKALIAASEYNMEFKNASLESVIEKIEKKFEVTVVLREPAAGKCRITADFTDQSLRNTLDMIGELLEINYSINGPSVTITGNGCS